jgi:hypothetical protein
MVQQPWHRTKQERVPASIGQQHYGPRRISMSFEAVQKLAKDNEVEWIDLRFTDMRGIHHHVTFPASTIDESTFRGRQDVRWLLDLGLEGHQ